MVRQRGSLGTRALMVLPMAANRRWSLDFASDRMTSGRFRALCVVDERTRECLALIADTSSSGVRAARELDAIVAWRGKPGALVSDNGTELTSNAILGWADSHKVEWHYIAPGRRCRMALSRASTAACGMRCLKETLFSSIAHARVMPAEWHADYNANRPRPIAHSAIWAQLSRGFYLSLDER
jgi:putative transposase